MTKDDHRRSQASCQPGCMIVSMRAAGLQARPTSSPSSRGILEIQHKIIGRAPDLKAHRVRVGCAEAMIYSSRGKIPIVLWTAHQHFGERVLLW
jgi:hypothetical protein